MVQLKEIKTYLLGGEKKEVIGQNGRYMCGQLNTMIWQGTIVWVNRGVTRSLVTVYRQYCTGTTVGVRVKHTGRGRGAILSLHASLAGRAERSEWARCRFSDLELLCILLILTSPAGYCLLSPCKQLPISHTFLLLAHCINMFTVLSLSLSWFRPMVIHPDSSFSFMGTFGPLLPITVTHTLPKCLYFICSYQLLHTY